MEPSRLVRHVVAAVATAILAVGGAYAQGYRFREGSLPARYAPEHMPDSAFVVCRLAYRSVRSEPMGIGWHPYFALPSGRRDQARLHLPHDELTRQCEQAIRNYDPCISCATHFLDLTVERS